MRKALVISCFAAALFSGPILATPEFPTVEVVKPLERESTGGCRNPIADAWERQGGFAISTEKTAAKNQPPTPAHLMDLPAYLTEGN